MENLLILIFKLCIFISLSFTFTKNALQMFQQNHYEVYRYTKWLFNKNNIKFSYNLIYIVLIVVINTLLNNLFGEVLVLLISIGYSIYLFYKEDKKQYIKDLVVTARVKRQIFVLFVLYVFAYSLLILLLPVDLVGVFSIILPYLFIYLMAFITSPFEEAVKKSFENDARNIINSNPNLIKVGVTGSYGKTSTKNIVNNIISDSYYSLITPASYNTPMGITRTIREMLKPIHEVFICEMGADKVDDIRYLMDFVKPKYGIVTSIGPQHLNTFHSLDNIIKEKMMEIEMLPDDGVGFINLDNELIAKYEIKNSCKVVSVGIDNTNADYVAKNVIYDKDGTKFTLKINKSNYKFKTVLLGKHNITNILLGIALALELGISIKDIQKAVSKIEQIEHRLQVKKINGYTFIDDAFNANPVGSKMSLDVLSMMPNNRVIVTPGMIDLGEKQDEINKEFGKYMLNKADYVILVGEKQTKPIYEGLIESGFDINNVLVVKTVNEAFNYVYKNFSTRDTILLENDLPDAFNV